MTGTCPDLLAALRQRERDLEADAAAVRARLEEVRDIIARLEGNPRKRPRKITVINMPGRIGGSAASNTPDGDDPDPDNGDAA